MENSYQLVSDIHLEFCKGKFPRIDRISSILILAGDIGVISDVESYNTLLGFIRQCCNRWEKVIYVLGNHEYYQCNDMLTTFNKFKENTRELSNFYLLDDNYLIINDIVIYGFTGWTIPTAKIRLYSRNLCDFDEIKINNSNLTLDQMSTLGRNGIIKFKEFIDKINNNIIECKAIIVVTHFPPIREQTSDPKYIGDNLNDYFSWKNLLVSEDIRCDKIKIWCSGHTHWSYDFIKGNIRFIGNQFGYKFENLKHYNKSFILEF